MKKRLLLIALVILLSTGTVMQTELHAEAAATTVTAVGVAKAILVLLAIAGVGITAGTIFDQGDLDESAVSKFTTWLQTRDPNTYTTMMVMAYSIAAGRVIQTMDAIFYRNLKTAVREYFGTDVTQSTQVGAISQAIAEISFKPNGTQTITIPTYGTLASSTQDYSVIGFSFEYGTSTGVFFLPIDKSVIGWNSQFGVIFNRGITIENITLYGTSNWTRFWEIAGSNVTYYNTHLSASTQSGARTLIQSVVNDFYAGRITTVDDDVLMRPFQTVGNVAATSADATVVAPGQTISEDENEEVVIDSDTTFTLANVNIDEWLKQLSDGVTSYADAMAALNLAAVNTQTQTLEEIQEIAQALNPAAAGTEYITGNYTVALKDLFPFCIPFDLYNIISCFKADPVSPSAEITIPVGYDGEQFTWETYTVSLSAFDAVAAVVRVLEYIGFVIGLMLVTRKLIEG